MLVISELWNMRAERSFSNFFGHPPTFVLPPLVGALAAGQPFHGLETSNLDDASDLDWIEVPVRLARERRFVVRIAGDSMEPFLRIGDLVVFEYRDGAASKKIGLRHQADHDQRGNGVQKRLR